MGNVKFHQMIEMKKMPRKGKYLIEKDAQKEKIFNWKDAQMYHHSHAFNHLNKFKHHGFKQRIY